MQYNGHKTGRAPIGPNVVSLCLHIKKGKVHFDTFNAHFIFAQFLIIFHKSKKRRCRLIEQTDALTMYNVFYFRLGSTSIGHARHVKTQNDDGLRIWIF